MVRVILCALTALWALLATAGPVTEDKYLGPEPFKRFTVAECRVTEFNPYDFHFRCTSQESFYIAHDELMRVRALMFGGYSRDYRELPEYISFWVKLKKVDTP